MAYEDNTSKVNYLNVKNIKNVPVDLSIKTLNVEELPISPMDKKGALQVTKINI